MTLQETLEDRFKKAIAAALGADAADAEPMVRPAGNPQFGDYQANAAMGLAKRLKRKPRDIAQQILDALDVDDLCAEAPTIAGPGFINLKLGGDWLGGALERMRADDRLGVPAVAKPETVVVDYSAPNVAKEMHVGHLRSTIIGDALARVLGFLGHSVHRANHVGDWGTQFGMLIEHMVDEGWTEPGDHSVADLNEMYQAARRKFDADDSFQERARRRVVALQGGDEATLELWRALIEESKRHFAECYERLDVLLTADDIVGESFYNRYLDDVVAELIERGLAVESQGALCVFADGFTDKEGEPLPFLVRKADGGYLYATTDCAAIRYRTRDLGASRVAYVVGAPQQDHFKMLFAVAKLAGWSEGVRLEHVRFGTILGDDNKPFKTREGGTVRLAELLDEAVARARQIVDDKQAEASARQALSDDQRAAVARAVGIGAVKYGDLSSDRVKDYVFSWERMLSFQGNTAPYLQNAYVRVRSIFRKAEDGGITPDPAATIRPHDDAERALALKLLQLPEVIAGVAESLEPHRLCTYLYELASAQHVFYERCPVLRAPDDATRDSRLALSGLVARTLESGLGLLGIRVLERM